MTIVFIVFHLDFYSSAAADFYYLQKCIAENFNIETVYVKEEFDATESQVKLAVQAVLFELSWFPVFIIL